MITLKYSKDKLKNCTVTATPFEKELRELINRHFLENGSDTPDFILASYLGACLENYNLTVCARDLFFKKD